MHFFKFLKFNFPQYTESKGLYYGWIVFIAGTLGVIMSIPGQTMGMSVYTEHLIQSLGVSRLQLSMAYMFGTLGSSFLLPFAGRLLDYFGARLMGTWASLSLGAFLLLLSLSPFISNFISQNFYLDPVWVSLFVVFICFLGIRHFGQGQVTLTSRTMLGLWFEKRRGLVLGLSGSIVAFAFGLAPLILNHFIENYGWQKSLHTLAFASFLMSLFAICTFRRSPEHSGLKVDGGLLVPPQALQTSSVFQSPVEEERQNQEPAAPEEVFPEIIEDKSFTLAEAKRSLVFWAFNLGFTAHALMLTAVVFHMASFAKHQNISTAQAFSVFLPVAVISTMSDLIGGYLSDRIRLRYLLAVMQSGLFLGLIGLYFFGHPAGFALMAIGVGISGGLFSLLTGAAWPKLFGRKHLGSIGGYSMGWMVSGSAVGPYLYSLGESLSGNYNTAIYTSLFIPLCLFLISFKIRNPRRKLTTTASN